MRVFDLADEERLLEDYDSTLVARQVRLAPLKVSQIYKACAAFREVHADSAVLSHVHTSNWVARWRDVQLVSLSKAMVCWRLQLLSGWFRWLFDAEYVDANAFVFSAARLIAGKDKPVTLRRSLQRAIATFMLERGPRQRRSQEQYRARLEDFNAFLNGHAQANVASILDDHTAIRAWLDDLWVRYKPSPAMQVAYVVNLFLRFLVETGRANKNPLEEILGGCRPREFRPALQSLMTDGVPRQRPPAKQFRSSFAEQIESHIKLKRALGHTYSRAERQLRKLDAFLADHSCSELDRAILTRWIASMQPLSPASVRG